MKSKSSEEKSETKKRGNCCCNCIEPILCSCYAGLASLLSKVFMVVVMCFIVYYCFLTLLQRREPWEAFNIALKDFGGVFFPRGDSGKT